MAQPESSEATTTRQNENVAPDSAISQEPLRNGDKAGEITDSVSRALPESDTSASAVMNDKRHANGTTKEQIPAQEQAGTQLDAPKSDVQREKSRAKAKPAANDQTASQKPSATGGTPKLSALEMKELKKAEKAARRAPKIQGKQGGAPATAGQVGESAKGQQHGPKDAGNAQHQRRGSVSTGDHRGLPVRSAKVPPVPEIPKVQSKEVAEFSHLYGKTRTNTIAGADVKVHPAVLALGLQMSNYVICGSTARLVATLLAFKRVRERLRLFICHARLPMPFGS